MDPKAYNPVTAIPGLNGRVILITGANAGIGKQTALELAEHHRAQVWIAARNIQSGKKAVEEIKQEAAGVDVRFAECDLTSFDSITSAAQTVMAEAKRLDILMLNAGIVRSYYHPLLSH
jgi:retinol dehydrogenase-12